MRTILCVVFFRNRSGPFFLPLYRQFLIANGTIICGKIVFYLTPSRTKYYFVTVVVFCSGGGVVEQNAILPQKIVPFAIKNCRYNGKKKRPELFLKNTTHKKKLKYAPISVLYDYIISNSSRIISRKIDWCSRAPV